MQRAGILIAAMACSLGLSTGAHAQYVSGAVPIDSTYKVLKTSGRDSAMGPFDVRYYIKPLAANGRLRLCGGYAAAVSMLTRTALEDGLRSYQSVAVIGKSDEKSAPRISPLSFFVFNLPSETLANMKAGCFDTTYEWKPDFARAPITLTVGAGRGQ